MPWVQLLWPSLQSQQYAFSFPYQIFFNSVLLPLTMLSSPPHRLSLGSGTDVKSLATFSSGPDPSERPRRKWSYSSPPSSTNIVPPWHFFIRFVPLSLCPRLPDKKRNGSRTDFRFLSSSLGEQIKDLPPWSGVRPRRIASRWWSGTDVKSRAAFSSGPDPNERSRHVYSSIFFIYRT